MIAVSDAVAKIQTLSDQRAARVVSMIEDLEQPVPWETVKAELDTRIAEREAGESANGLPSHD